MSTTQIREAVEAASKVLSEQPEKARGETTPAVAVVEDGLKCRVTGPSGETVHTDMAAGVGGGDSAPQPGWLMRAGLASCNATCIALRAAQCGIELSELEVTVSGQVDKRGMLGVDDSVAAGVNPLRLHVKVGAPDTSEKELRDLILWAKSHSPVGCTDLSSAEVDIQIV